MQKIELIAIDVDGTLIPAGRETISQENIDAILKAQKQGIKVIIATGRIYSHIKEIEHILSIQTPIIALNGADIRHNGKFIKKSLIPKNLVKQIICKTEKFKSAARMIFNSECIFAERNNLNGQLIDEMRRIVAAGVTQFNEFTNIDDIYPLINNDIYKILLWASCTKEFDSLKAALGELHGELEVSNSEGLNLEINKNGVSKETGVNFVAKYLGVSKDRILAIGDSGNDVGMLRSAAIGIAVANASKIALEAADYITDSCYENGVAKAIYNFALI